MFQYFPRIYQPNISKGTKNTKNKENRKSYGFDIKQTGRNTFSLIYVVHIFYVVGCCKFDEQKDKKKSSKGKPCP